MTDNKVALLRELDAVVQLMEQRGLTPPANIEDGARKFVPGAIPWQVEAFYDQSPIVLFTGAAGGGKSYLAVEKVHAFLLENPGAFGLMLRKTATSLKNSIVLFYQENIVGEDPRVKHVPSKSRFEYTNGSILAYGGMADKEQREKIRSVGKRGGVDIAWLEEATAFTESDFNEILARMRGVAGPYRQIILTTNPDSPAHWIYLRLIQKHEAVVYESSARDNPFNPDTYIDALEKLTGVQRERLLYGRWVQAEGVIYELFNPNIHIVDPFDIPKDWRRYLSIDFGYNNPFVALWAAVDGDGTIYVYRELYVTEQLVSDLAERIKSLTRLDYPDDHDFDNPARHFANAWADHDLEDRATLDRHGIRTAPALKEVNTGIEAVKMRFRIDARGKPRMVFFRDMLVEEDRRLVAAHRPVGLFGEITLYSWQKTTSGEFSKDIPIKDNDHAMDALRYLVMGVQGAPRRLGIW